MKRICVNYLLWFAVAITATCALLGGCGQKGDLYLPDDHDSREQRE